jgi:hypothetical protein
MYMLIDYDQKIGRLVSHQVFKESERSLAERTRLDLELFQHAAGVMREVVILRAVDEAQIRLMHRRYFETLEELLAPDTLKRYASALDKTDPVSV